MRFAFTVLLTILISGLHTGCYALRCNCDDWMERGGYCVDYIQTKIPTFTIPLKEDMPYLQNTEVSRVTEGDVAVFAVRNYWHVAYVEKVRRNHVGEATAIDVSEMNFGGELSFAEFKDRWKINSRAQWNRALCCGITDSYDEITVRRNVDIDAVKQVWSPDDVTSEGGRGRGVKAIFGKAKNVFNRFIEFTEGSF